jgi:hypothetical protein
MMSADRDQVAQIAAAIDSSLMPDNRDWVNRFTVASTSSSSVYTVAQRRSDNVWGCSCWGWKRHRHCKHLHVILGRLAELSMTLNPEAMALLRSARTAYLDLESTPVAVAAQRQPARRLDL